MDTAELEHLIGLCDIMLMDEPGELFNTAETP